jgi:hypothetical protein
MSELPQTNYLKYYNLESFLFEDVHKRFHTDHSLGAFDFFSIIIWKANRAKSRIALKLLAVDPKGRRDLECIVRTLTSALYKCENEKERLRLLMLDWKFALPMASAILSVCWPDEFTVYDYRIRERLGGFPDLNHLTNFEQIWSGFTRYQGEVCKLAPAKLSLRDKDRFLWGESLALQLNEDIKTLFHRENSDHGPAS